MKKQSFVSRFLVILLALAMVVPMLSIGANAAIGDLHNNTGGTGLVANADGSYLDTTDTVSLPIKIYDYKADGMLFEHANGIGETYSVPTDYYHDYHATTYLGGEVIYYATSDFYCSLKNAGTDSQYLRLTTPNENRAVDKVSYFNAVNVSKIRYVTVVMRMPCSSYRDEYNASNVYDNRSGLIAFSLDGNEGAANSSGWSGWHTIPKGHVGSNNWFYMIVDLQAAGDISGSISTLYLHTPVRKTTEYIDIATIGYFSSKEAATEYGEYGITLGSDNGDNRGFSLLRSSRTEAYLEGTSSTVKFHSIHDWVRTELSDSTIHNVNTYVNPAAELSDYDFGYKMFGTFEDNGVVTMGLLESSLSKDGLPVYKEQTVTYLANLLKSTMSVPERTADGWVNYTFLRGEKIARYGKDTNENGTIEANEYRDLPAALRDSLGVNPATGKGGTLGTYAATKAKHSQLMGTWEACAANIDTFFDAAYYLLNNIFTHNSYNLPQKQYNYLILSKATANIDGSKKGVYVFDAGLTDTAAVSGNINTSGVKSAVSYNTTLKTISNTANAAGKTQIEYDLSGYTTTMFPFLPLTSTNNSAGETKSPYYEDDDVNTLLNYGGTYVNRNYNYVLESKGEFLYYADDNLYFEFEGDDDVYLFINGELVLDIGATHGISRETININDYVNWARTVLLAPEKYTAAEVARAKKLNLQEGGSYSFDFFYMERHGWGANMRIMTNIRVTDTKMEVDKTAYQDGVEVNPLGTIDKTKNVEYGIAIHNDALPGFGRLFYLNFEDDDIGVALSPDNGLVIKDGYNGVRVFDENGGTLDITDIVAYVDGYYDYGFETQRPMETIKVTFETNEELIEFLKTMASDDGTDGTPENNGLWEGSTVLFRGIYYKLTEEQINDGVFTNTVHATANSLATGEGTTLEDEDTVHVFTHNEPKYYHWAGKTLSISMDEMVDDIVKSSIWAGADKNKLPSVGNLTLSIVNKDGSAAASTDVVLVKNEQLWFEVKYDAAGTHIFYVKAVDKTDPTRTVIIPVTIYSMAVKDEVMVLDYGLNANLTENGELFRNDTLHTDDRDTQATIMGYLKDGAYAPGYITEDYTDTLTNLGGTYNGSLFTDARFQLENPINLKHDAPWVLEWEASGNWMSGILALSETEASNVDGNKYLFMTATGGLVAIGTRANNNYNNYGVRISEMGIDITKSHVYRLVNQPDGSSGNMIYLYVDGVEMGPMTTHVLGGTNVQDAPSTWVSGKDFSFKYMGSSTHPLRNTGIGYVKVWENGISDSNIRWEPGNNGDLVCVTKNNGLTKISGSTSDGTYTNHQYRLDENIVLAHDKEWTLEWKGVMKGNMLLSAIESNQSTANRANRRYLFVYPSGGMIAFGYHGTYGTDSSNQHRNFGVRGIANMSTSNYTYKLVNTIDSSGNNTIRVYVDDVFKGNMTTYTIAGNGVQAGVNTWLNGKDLVFSYLGARGYQLSGTFEYIEVNTGTEDTALTHNLVNDNGVFYDLMNANTANRIDFVDKGISSLTYNDGKYTKSGTASTITYENGAYALDGSLNFKPTAFMDEEYTMWMAVSVHEADFTPSAIGSKDSNATIDISNEVQMYKKVTVLPATVIYYEDDFPAISYIKTTTNSFTAVGDSDNYTQGADQDENYGHDEFYEGNTNTASAGTLTTITINQSGPIAEFTFKGTGFELISRTDANDSAVMVIEVYQIGSKTGEAADPIRRIPVVVEFDQNSNGEGGTEIIHQVPVIRVDELPLSSSTETYTYRVVIKGIPARDLDAEGAPIVPRNLYIDGLRIFQPMGSTNDNYNDSENGATFTELRNEVIRSNAAIMKNENGTFSIGTGTTTWTENRNGTLSDSVTTYNGNVVTSINEYTLLGPNNEVYMDGADTTKSAIVLYVKETGTGAHSLQIAARGIDRGSFYGTGSTGINAAVNIYTGSAWTSLTTLKSGTEQYYTIDYTKCQQVNGAYQVIIAVDTGMASFSSLKYNGLELVSMNGAATTAMYENGELKVYENGNWVSTSANYPAFNTLSAIMLANESEPDTGVTENSAAINLSSATLSFESEILVNLYFSVDGIESNDIGLLTWSSEPSAPSMDNAETVIPGFVYDAENERYMVQTNGIAAKNLGDDIYLCVYAKRSDGSYAYSKVITYSPKTYALSRLEKSSNDDLKALCVAMLNYGAAAQEYFGYKTDSLMNADLSAEQQALVLPYSSELVADVASVDESKVGVFVKTEGFSAKTASASFNSTFNINFYFTAENEVEGGMTFYYWTAADYAAAEVLSAENASGVTAMTVNENDAYWAAYAGIAAKEIDDTIYVCGVYESNGETYCTGLVSYSLGNYCRNRAENADSNMNGLAEATVVYGYHAKAYFTAE